MPVLRARILAVSQLQVERVLKRIGRDVRDDSGQLRPVRGDQQVAERALVGEAQVSVRRRRT